ncbi:sensor histidine kinase [Aquimarina sp. 2201CG5-10]|uniref:sensor histidine kinase n=1 Tax=Aquimarina callyspongiae TaxID=3098150 RepID=UPI002AB4FF3C|nr:sensor histidine kinase [Aquimarina sp. 2201CG5-10]MDY8136080.1 sensor histidine kinase [Aquimarina sp. 2201CG5-10]
MSIRAMIEGQEDERKRIASDLHDRLGSMLSMVKLHYQSVEKNIEHLNISNQRQYSKANLLLDKACAEVRNIAHNMVSGTLTKFGLIAALDDLKDSLEDNNTVNIDLIVHGFKNRLEQKNEINIYRIIQELISNVLKHANASEIVIQLIFNQNGLNLIVEDNGNGFEVNNISKDGGMGLKNVLSRVDEIKGELNIDSSLDKGTTVTIDIPLNELIEL